MQRPKVLALYLNQHHDQGEGANKNSRRKDSLYLPPMTTLTTADTLSGTPVMVTEALPVEK